MSVEIWWCVTCDNTDIITYGSAGRSGGCYLAPESKKLTERPQQREWIVVTGGVQPTETRAQWPRDAGGGDNCRYCSPECLEASLKKFLDECMRSKRPKP
jgi:hypothetical protein